MKRIVLSGAIFLFLFSMAQELRADRVKDYYDLMGAVLDNRYEEVDALLARGVNIDETGDRKETCLMIAADYKLTGMTEYLLKKGADVQRRDGRGQTPLMHALGGISEYVVKTTTAEQKLATAKALIKYGAKVNDADTFLGFTPLHHASHDAVNTDYRIIEYLVSLGADVRAKDKYGQTPLHLEAGRCRYATVKLLIDKGAEIDPVSTYAAHETPLLSLISTYSAVAFDPLQKRPLEELVKERDQIAELLLSRKANPNFQNQNGNTPLHEAIIDVYSQPEKLIRLLHKYGADMNLKNKAGKSPMLILQEAYRDGLIDETILKKYEGLLLSLGAKPETAGSDPLKFLMGAIVHENIAEVKKCLQDGADANGMNKEGWTPLRQALFGQNNVKIGELLIQHGADVNRRSPEGTTILIDMSKGNSSLEYMGQSEVFKFLVQHGADVNLADNEGKTALFYRAAANDGQALKILLDGGADLNLRDKAGRTALFDARDDAAKTLITKGAFLEFQDLSGKTALSYVIDSSLDTAVILIDAGADVNTADTKGTTPLMCAASQYPGRPVNGFIDKLIAKGAKLDRRDKKGQTALGYALQAKKHYRGTSDIVVEHLKSLGAKE